MPGKIALLIFLAMLVAFIRMMPPRGPRRRLVRGRGDDVGVRHRVRVHAGGDQAGVVRHVDHEVGADRLGHLGEALEVDAQRVGRGAGDDQLGLVLVRQALHRVVVDLFLGVQAVADTTLNHLPLMFSGMPWVRWPPSARLMPMIVSPGCSRPKNTRLVGLRAGVRLHVGVLGAEQLLQRGRWPAARRRRRTRSRRSSACPGSPRRTCW